MERIKEESFGIIPLRHSDEGWRVLVILHKQGNHWAFPKGNADPGEEPLQSAIRELREETGLKVEKLLKEEAISEGYSFFRKGKQVEKTVHYFPAIVSGVLLLQPEEISDGIWLCLDDAKKQLTFEEAKRICSQIQQDLEKESV